MKIRTESQLLSLIDDIYSWRFFELLTLKDLLCDNQKDTIKKNALLRSSIAILYAHWEGFIKEASEYYLQFVVTKGHLFKELEVPFQVLAIKNELDTLGECKKMSLNKEMLERIFDKYNKRATISYNNIINTQSNLSSIILKEIIDTIGLNYSQFQLKDKIIDGKLLYYRNQIAHGEYLEIDDKGFTELFDYIIPIMQSYKTEIEEAVINKKYLA